MEDIAMNIAQLLIAILVPLVILERVLLHVLVRRRHRQLPFRLYYLLGVYKPLIIVAAFVVLIISRGESLLRLGVFLLLGVLSVVATYPIARFFYSRMPQHDVQGDSRGE